MIRNFRLLLMIFVLALFASPVFEPVARATGEMASDFTLRDINNRPVKLSDFKGKVVLVSFWATWCQPCQVEMPHLQKMYEALGDKGFVVLSISADDARSASMVKPLVKRNGYTFPVLLDKETAVVSQWNPGKTLPYTVLVDREGRVAYTHMGYTPGEEVDMQKRVEALLAGGELPGGAE